jgi:hypothetical protein
MNVIVHQNLSDKIYELLKEMIVRWEYRPGQRLIDSELAQQYVENFSMILGDDTAGDETADSLAIPLPPMKENTR